MSDTISSVASHVARRRAEGRGPNDQPDLKKLADDMHDRAIKAQSALFQLKSVASGISALIYTLPSIEIRQANPHWADVLSACDSLTDVIVSQAELASDYCADFEVDSYAVETAGAAEVAA